MFAKSDNDAPTLAKAGPMYLSMEQLSLKILNLRQMLLRYEEPVAFLSTKYAHFHYLEHYCYLIFVIHLKAFLQDRLCFLSFPKDLEMHEI